MYTRSINYDGGKRAIRWSGEENIETFISKREDERPFYDFGDKESTAFGGYEIGRSSKLIKKMHDEIVENSKIFM